MKDKPKSQSREEEWEKRLNRKFARITFNGVVEKYHTLKGDRTIGELKSFMLKEIKQTRQSVIDEVLGIIDNMLLNGIQDSYEAQIKLLEKSVPNY